MPVIDFSPEGSPSQGISPDEVRLTLNLLDAHGARGFGVGDRRSFGEADRWHASRVLWVCVPGRAFALRPGRDKFVPLVEEYLVTLGLTPSRSDCLILKGVIEQIIRTSPQLCGALGLQLRRKYGVADLRAQGKYGSLVDAQSSRCAVCGILLDRADSVELDHIVPFSLIGDIGDGSNWQILCGVCNLGKHEYVSSWVVPDAWNWIAPSNVALYAREPSVRARYAVLAERRGCGVDDCGMSAGRTRLFLVRISSRGMWVPSNLQVLCEEHATGLDVK